MTERRTTTSRGDHARNLHDGLVAFLLGDAPASAAVHRWLATREGRGEAAAYRRALARLDRAFGTARGPGRVAPVHYTSVRTPIGRVFVAASDVGLVRIAFRQSERRFTADLRRALGADLVAGGGRDLAAAVRQIEAYFRGRRHGFDVPVDLRRVTPFQRRVLLATRRIASGDVVSYGDIARRIGCPRGSRAVGQALGRNPIPIVIPCHRVVSGGGGLGGYTGGLDIKRKLLRLEGAAAA
jgi:methylated-DNA-[protein]-cysteine S-methyltransferase